MKKITYWIVAAFMTLASVDTANGQSPETDEVIVETIDIESPECCEKTEYAPSTDDERGRMIVKAGGVEIIIDNESKATGVSMLLPDGTKKVFRQNNNTVTTVKKNKRRIAEPGHIAFLEIGVNLLPAPDYSAYRGAGDFLDLRNAASLQWAFTLPDISLKLTRDGMLAFSAGLQIIWNNYVFANDITLIKEDGMVVPVPVSNPKKTKLTTFGLQIPVIMEFNLPGRVFLAAGVYGGVNIGMNTKVKFPKDKMRDPYMNPLYWGVTGRVGYGSFYVYANYGMSNLFKKDKGPAVAPVTIGVGIGF